MRHRIIFDGNDDLIEHIDQQLSNSEITVAHLPGNLRFYFKLPVEHSTYGGLMLTIPIDAQELINKLQECVKNPGETPLLQWPDNQTMKTETPETTATAEP